MSNKDYTVDIDKQGGYINTGCGLTTKLDTNCIICGNKVVINVWDTIPQVCEDCKSAVHFAKVMRGGKQ
jgi:hypothetical protein